MNDERERVLTETLEHLTAAIRRGRKLYPEGCTILSLSDEAGEVDHDWKPVYGTGEPPAESEPELEPPLRPSRRSRGWSKRASRSTDVGDMARWIRQRTRAQLEAGEGLDHACAQCYPEGDIVIPGFVCAVHLAHDIPAAPAELASIAAGQTPSHAKGYPR